MKKTKLLLLTLSTCPLFVNAASLDELRAINASQKEGMTIVCTSSSTLPMEGLQEPIIIDTTISGYVKKNLGDIIIFDATISTKLRESKNPLATMQFEMKSSLKEDHQENEINKKTIKASSLYDKSYESKLIDYYKENNLSRDYFYQVQITKFPSYTILARKDSPNDPITSCGPLESENSTVNSNNSGS